jgi:hypothetical protein
MYPRLFRALPLLASVALFTGACQDDLPPTAPAPAESALQAADSQVIWREIRDVDSEAISARLAQQIPGFGGWSSTDRAILTSGW